MRLSTQRRHEESVRAPAVGLGVIEREVGIGDQVVGIAPVVGRDRDAGAAADVQDVVGDVERLRELREHRVDDLGDDARIAAVRDDHDEFVAAEPADLAAARGHAGEALRHLDQQPVAGRMTDGVIDVLEAVEIEQRDGGRATGFQSDQLVVERHAIGQAGQLIEVREVAELLLGLLAVGDVVIGPGNAPDGAVGIVHRRRRHPDVDQRAVLVTALDLQVADRFAADCAVEKACRNFLVVRRNELGPLPQHLLGGIAENPFRGVAPQDQSPVGVRADDGNRRSVDDRGERFLRLSLHVLRPGTLERLGRGRLARLVKLAMTGLERGCHRIEGVRQGADLVAAADHRAVAQVAGRERRGILTQLPQRPDGAAGEGPG